MLPTTEKFKILADLADTIWREHYTPIIGSGQVEYMLNKYQSENAIRQQIKNGAKYYLILKQGRPVGYFSYNIQESALFLSKFYILKSERGKGIGRAALLFIESRTRAQDLNKIKLTVNKNNSKSIKAYEKMGFENVDSIVQDIGNGYVMDDFVMEKTVG